MVVTEGIDPSSSAYEAGAHPSTPRHPGVPDGDRTHAYRNHNPRPYHLATDTTKPYRNTPITSCATNRRILRYQCVFIWSQTNADRIRTCASRPDYDYSVCKPLVIISGPVCLPVHQATCPSSLQCPWSSLVPYRNTLDNSLLLAQ